MPAPKSRGRPRRWCSERCRREVWKWRRQEGMKRDALMLMKAIEASWPTAYAAEVIAELEHELEVVEWTRSQDKGRSG